MTGSDEPISIASAGFSLIEMLVVLLILAIVSGTFSIGMRDRTPDPVAVAQEIAGRLSQVRIAAVVEARPKKVTFDLAGRQVAFDGDASTLMLPGGVDMTLLVGQELVEARKANLMYYPDGSSTGATVTLRQGRQSAKIRVLWLTGIPQVETHQ